MKQFTPSVYNYTNPVGLDFQIQQVQMKLARMNFMECIFGRANIQYRVVNDQMADNFMNPSDGVRGRDKYMIYYPQGRQMGKDIDLSFNDSYASSCFFLARNPISANVSTDKSDWTDENIELASPMSMIAFFNLNKLEVESSETIKTAVLYALNMCPYITLGNISENCDDVWREFTMTLQMQGFTKFPYYALRIDFTLTYMALPFNGNDYLNPSIYDVPSNEQNIQPNTTPNKPNLN